METENYIQSILKGKPKWVKAQFNLINQAVCKKYKKFVEVKALTYDISRLYCEFSVNAEIYLLCTMRKNQKEISAYELSSIIFLPIKEDKCTN